MRPATLLPVALLALALPGCQSSPGVPQYGLRCDHDALEDNKRPAGAAVVAMAYGSISDMPTGAVLIGNKSLYNKVIVQSLYAERTATNTMKVTARIANCTNDEVALRARAVFLGSGMAPIEAPSAWQVVFIAPKSVSAYEESSLSAASAQQYYLEFVPN